MGGKVSCFRGFFCILLYKKRTPQNVSLFQSSVIVLGNAGKLDGVGVVICCDC